MNIRFRGHSLLDSSENLRDQLQTYFRLVCLFLKTVLNCMMKRFKYVFGKKQPPGKPKLAKNSDRRLVITSTSSKYCFRCPVKNGKKIVGRMYRLLRYYRN